MNTDRKFLARFNKMLSTLNVSLILVFTVFWIQIQVLRTYVYLGRLHAIFLLNNKGL